MSEVRPFIALPASHDVAKSKRVPWKKLSEMTFIGYERDLLPFELQLRALAAHSIEPASVISVTSSDAILAFVAEGLGYSIVPSLSATGPRVEGVHVRQLSKPARSFPVHAAWRKSSWENPLVSAFLAEAPKKDGRR